MKNLIFSMLCFIFLAGLSRGVTPLYQVISQHPHDLKELSPFVETVSEEGRLWIVQLKRPAPQHVMRHLRIIGDRKLGSWLEEGVAHKSIARFVDVVADVSVESIKADIVKLSSFKTRLVGSEDNRKAVAWSQDRLKSLGYQTQQVCYEVGRCSVIADRPGSEAGILLVIAHIDSVGKDFAGADDNGSGTAALLEMARVLSTQNLRHGLRFFITNGEESGMLGAEHYADQLAANGEIRQIHMAINMDMVGYNSNGIVELETDAPFESLAKEFADWAKTYTSLKTKITLGAWGSDHVPFIQKDVPTLLTIENWSTKTPCYHTSCDKPDTINYVYAGEITKLNVAAILNKDKE